MLGLQAKVIGREIHFGTRDLSLDLIRDDDARVPLVVHGPSK
jgi:hypothetical protein